MKNIKKITQIILVFIVFSFTVGCAVNKDVSNNKNIKIHYIDVGQADSELIQIDGKNILIDAGCNDNKALNYLKSIGVTNLDYVIATHPHEDHIGGMATIINNFNIDNFYAPKVNHTTKTFENMIKALQNKKIKITAPTVGDTITIGNSTLQFLAPNSAKYDDLNNYSIVTRLKYGNKSFIFSGDAENLSEGEILAKQLDISGDVLKLGHHGSHSSTSQAFLDKVNPKYAIISVGKDNDYGHPHKETIDKLNAKGIKSFRTDLSGTIIASCNGNDITFNVNSTENTDVTSNKSKIDNSSNSNTTNISSDNVWVASNTSNVYHSDKNCSKMKNPSQITVQQAKDKGLKPCSKCSK